MLSLLLLLFLLLLLLAVIGVSLCKDLNDSLLTLKSPLSVMKKSTILAIPVVFCFSQSDLILLLTRPPIVYSRSFSSKHQYYFTTN